MQKAILNKPMKIKAPYECQLSDFQQANGETMWARHAREKRPNPLDNEDEK